MQEQHDILVNLADAAVAWRYRLKITSTVLTRCYHDCARYDCVSVFIS